jgi:hypothetical protein
MQRKHKASTNQIVAFSMLAPGIILVVISSFCASSFLAILGVAIVFWGAILLYIKPSKYVHLSLLNALAEPTTSNAERILSELNLTGKGRYLPPKYLKNFESSLVFVPERPDHPLTGPEIIDEEKLFSKNPGGVFLTPPGMTLCRLFEQELGVSFTKTDLAFMQRNLPKLLIENVELAETAEIQTQNDLVTVEITGNLLQQVCQETLKLTRTHEAVGCLLSSAIACVLAKATGRVVTIQKEEQAPDGKTKVEYRIEGE